MTRYAVGDVQGCHDELRALLARVRFAADRDQLWFVGDLVNRGPRSLETLRLVHAMRDNAIVVLGNHDLHLLAVAAGVRRSRRSDTLDEVLGASDRDTLLEWLARQHLAHRQGSDLMVHAGVLPQWTVELTLSLAGEVAAALERQPRALLERMYGNEPERWLPGLEGMERLRFVINVLTRMRMCTADGRVDVSLRGAATGDEPMRAWFDHSQRATREARVIFGHWSALGLVQRANVIGLDTGCVWGGALTAFDLDADRPPISVPCAGYQRIGTD